MALPSPLRYIKAFEFNNGTNGMTHAADIPPDDYGPYPTIIFGVTVINPGGVATGFKPYATTGSFPTYWPNIILPSGLDIGQAPNIARGNSAGGLRARIPAEPDPTALNGGAEVDIWSLITHPSGSETGLGIIAVFTPSPYMDASPPSGHFNLSLGGGLVIQDDPRIFDLGTNLFDNPFSSDPYFRHIVGLETNIKIDGRAVSPATFANVPVWQDLVQITSADNLLTLTMALYTRPEPVPGPAPAAADRTVNISNINEQLPPFNTFPNTLSFIYLRNDPGFPVLRRAGGRAQVIG